MIGLLAAYYGKFFWRKVAAAVGIDCVESLSSYGGRYDLQFREADGSVLAGVDQGGELAFGFDPNHAYLDRAVLRIADQLGIAQFEQHRTHWAIKDGEVPAELIATGTAKRAQRTVAVVAGEYVETLDIGIRGVGQMITCYCVSCRSRRNGGALLIASERPTM